MTKRELQVSGKRSAIIKKSVIGGLVGAPILALSVYGMIKFDLPALRPVPPIPETSPVISTQQGTHPGDLPPAAANPATPTEKSTIVPFQRPDIGAELEAKIEAAAQVHVADDLMKKAKAEQSLLCRVVRYCEARKLYDRIQDTLETTRACTANCDKMKVRAKSRQAYIELRLAEYKAPIMDSIACLADQEICACVALGAGTDCQ